MVRGRSDLQLWGFDLDTNKHVCDTTAGLAATWAPKYYISTRAAVFNKDLGGGAARNPGAARLTRVFTVGAARRVVYVRGGADCTRWAARSLDAAGRAVTTSYLCHDHPTPGRFRTSVNQTGNQRPADQTPQRETPQGGQGASSSSQVSYFVSSLLFLALYYSKTIQAGAGIVSPSTLV